MRNLIYILFYRSIHIFYDFIQDKSVKYKKSYYTFHTLEKEFGIIAIKYLMK